MNVAHLNSIMGCTGLYDEAFYGMGPLIGVASPKLRNKMIFLAIMEVNMF